ncbi:MAG: flagellar biosynthetic protein FliO [Planctomycetaceae bacterium]|nr:flagellar biosynthetic protein FliO [Planctomycetaceae bacterium]
MPCYYFIPSSVCFIAAVCLVWTAPAAAQVDDAFSIPATQSSATFTPKRSLEVPQSDAELRRVKESFANTSPAHNSSANVNKSVNKNITANGKTAAQVSFAEEIEPPRRINQQQLQPAEPLPPPSGLHTAGNSAAGNNNASSTARRPVAQAAFQKPPSFTLEDSNEEPASALPERSEEAADPILDKPLKRKKQESDADKQEADAENTDTEGQAAKQSSSRSHWSNKLPHPDWSASLSPVISVAGSLLIVLSAFFLIALVFKKVSPKSCRPLPKEAFENLGRTYITAKQQLQLFRLGNRLILVAVTPDGVSPVSEVTDSDEVLSLLGMCRRLDTNSATDLFQKTVARITDDEINQSIRSVRREPHTASRNKNSRNASLVDLYSDPDESLAEMLAKR